MSDNDVAMSEDSAPGVSSSAGAEARKSALVAAVSAASSRSMKRKKFYWLISINFQHFVIFVQNPGTRACCEADRAARESDRAELAQLRQISDLFLICETTFFRSRKKVVLMLH